MDPSAPFTQEEESASPPPRKDSLLELVGVSRSYGATRALEPTDLAVPRNRTTVLIGPSGCGKSTLLRLMIGLVTPETGKVFFDGTEVTARSAPALRRRMGYVIQEGGLFPHLTARGNITLMARHLRLDSGRLSARLFELTEMTRFPPGGLDRYPTQLSGGQRQRVALMRALILDPDLLLLDEPLGALDPIIRSELQEDLRRIFQSLKKTVVLVTHDIGEAGFFGDLVVFLKAGRVLQRGPFGELVRSPADPFVQRFIGAQRGLPVTAGDGSP